MEEVVVLVSDDGEAIGTAEKSTVHGLDTPLHRAFSCYVFDDAGRVLITRRALSKRTWPGVWTNSLCGHPGPGEPDRQAIVRRAEQELGTRLTGIAPALPEFRYRAVDAGGTVENEVCPVYTARLAGELSPNPDEVAEWDWVSSRGLVQALAGAPSVFSPWLQLQVPGLVRAGLLPAIDGEELP